MTDRQLLDRRSFVKKSTGIGAGIAAVHSILPPTILGANDRVVMGLIGSGGRGRTVMQMFRKEGIPFAAVGDVYEPNLLLGLQAAGDNAQSYIDYRKVIERNDIDAVLIATPDHHHCPQLVAAIQAGKDVYCEKPLSYGIEEGVKTVQEVRKTKQVVQIGMQRRSAPFVLEAHKLMEEGKLGKVHMCRAEWFWQRFNFPLDNSPLPGKIDWDRFCEPRPVIDFEPMKFRHWRFFWNFSGGNVTDQGTHLIDVIQWFMKSGTPQSAECFGKVYESIGSETPDTFSAIYDYGNFLASWTLVYSNGYQKGWRIYFQGDKGTLILDDDGYRLFEEPWEQNRDKPPAYEMKGSISAEPHVRNFLECIKTRQNPNAPIEIGHQAVSAMHLTNAAWHHKKRAYLNRDATNVSFS